jgi:hypothetical protein
MENEKNSYLANLQESRKLEKASLKMSISAKNCSAPFQKFTKTKTFAKFQIHKNN